ncbi:MAG TPA: hypothetical protein ENF24_02765 [Methanosarcinales archaeon]|nr:hypothetical protein [Methanosarcinales archaeon]
MNRNIRLIGILAMVLLVATVQMAGAESQDWRLLNTERTVVANDSTDHYRDFFMNKTGNATGTSMILPNMTEKTTWWYAESPAQFDGLTFGEGNWTVNLSHGPTNGCTIWANVCKVNDIIGEVTYLANGSTAPSSSSRVDTITCYDNPDTDQVFNTTDRLALRIYHNRTGTTTTLQIYYYKTSRHSRLTSPSTDPGYPVPNLPTIILTTTGILVLAGYASLRRSRKTDK